MMMMTNMMMIMIVMIVMIVMMMMIVMIMMIARTASNRRHDQFATKLTTVTVPLTNLTALVLACFLNLSAIAGSFTSR